MTRSCGILLPIASLPSPHGIGTLGADAHAFIDFLAAAKQSWWQILPIGPTGYGDSPYQSFSSYAGNPYYIDLDLLCADGLLTKAEIDGCFWGADDTHIDYGAVYAARFSLLEKAAARGIPREGDALAAFTQENGRWLDDYALFMALKRHFSMQPWYEWPLSIRRRDSEALAHYRTLLAEDIRFFCYLQFLFARQWRSLREHARKCGISILGDLPIYVAMDSADVWAEPHFFQLDSDRRPTFVAGVPPDAFSADGQLWGNPLYDWDAMQSDGFGWWIRRVERAGELYDALRIDHFRGFESYWAVACGAPSAKSGHWVKGPGMRLLRVLRDWFPHIIFLAEDLGILTPEVHQLLRDFGAPGMKVLSFAFSPDGGSDYLPHRYTNHCVCYTGTHDNAPLSAWCSEAAPDEVAFAARYLGLHNSDSVADGILRCGMASVADLFIAQMQDYLALGAASRTNIPGTSSGNWQWRMSRGACSDALARRLASLAQLYGRAEER